MGLLSIFLLMVGFYHVVLRPWWIEGFGTIKVPLCKDIVLTLPGEVPRSFQGDDLLPNHTAIIRSNWAFRVNPAKGGEVLPVGDGKAYHIWVPPDYWDNKIDVEVITPRCQRRVSISVESKKNYLAKRLVAIAFGWPLATVVAIVGLGWQVYQYHDRKIKKQQELEKEFRDTLQGLPLSEQVKRYYQNWRERQLDPRSLVAWWKDYTSLHLSLYERHEALQIVIADIWLPTWQQDNGSIQPHCGTLEDLHASGMLPDTQYQEFEKTYCSSDETSNLDFLPLIRILGLHPNLITLLKSYYRQHLEALPRAIEAWTSKLKHIGFAIGQAVYSTLSKENLPETQAVEKVLSDPPPPRPHPPRLAIWPPRPPTHACTYWNLQSLDGPEEIPSPFGPPKAENDPRLPPPFGGEDPLKLGLFWEESSLWQAVQAPEHTWFTTTPGCGATALIWMARHRYRYWGSQAEEPRLSLYLPFAGEPPFSDTLCRRAFQQALAKAILLNLSEDPTWFLGIPHTAWRRDIVALLYHQYGDAERILGQLLPGSPANNDVVFEALENHIRSFDFPAPSFPWEPRPWETLGEALQTIRASMARFGSRGRQEGIVPLRILLEVHSLYAQLPKKSLESLIACPFWAWGTVKAFAPQEPPTQTLTVRPCQWSQDALQAMLAHRMRQVALRSNETLLRSLFAEAFDHPASSNTSWESLSAHIIEMADNPQTPQALIGWGNQYARRQKWCIHA